MYDITVSVEVTVSELTMALSVEYALPAVVDVEFSYVQFTVVSFEFNVFTIAGFVLVVGHILPVLGFSVVSKRIQSVIDWGVPVGRIGHGVFPGEHNLLQSSSSK